MVGSHWRVRLVDFDCLCFKEASSLKKEEEEGKEDKSRSKPGKNGSR